MEPGGGVGVGVGGSGPLPGNNKARGGAVPPGKARDLGRPPRKDSEVSAAAAGPGSAGGWGGVPGRAASFSPPWARGLPVRCWAASGLTRAVLPTLRHPPGRCFGAGSPGRRSLGL